MGVHRILNISRQGVYLVVGLQINPFKSQFHLAIHSFVTGAAICIQTNVINWTNWNSICLRIIWWLAPKTMMVTRRVLQKRVFHSEIICTQSWSFEMAKSVREIGNLSTIFVVVVVTRFVWIVNETELIHRDYFFFFSSWRARFYSTRSFIHNNIIIFSRAHTIRSLAIIDRFKSGWLCT